MKPSILKNSSNNKSSALAAAQNFPRCSISEFASLIHNYCKINAAQPALLFTLQMTAGPGGTTQICSVRFKECPIALPAALNDTQQLQAILKNLIPTGLLFSAEHLAPELLNPDLAPKERLLLLLELVKRLNCQLSGPLASLNAVYLQALSQQNPTAIAQCIEQFLAQCGEQPQLSVITPSAVHEISREITSLKDDFNEVQLSDKVRALIQQATTKSMSGYFAQGRIKIDSPRALIKGSHKALKTATDISLITTGIKTHRTLNSVLRPARAEAIKLLNLYRFSPEQLKAISSALSSYANLKKIDLNSNELASRLGYLFLNNLKIKFGRVIDLNLEDNRLREAPAKAIARLIRNNPQLEQIKINFAYNLMNKSGTASINAAISQNRHLSSLDLNFKYNQLDQAGMANLAQAIAQNPHLQSLTLNFAYIDLNDEMIGSFSAALSLCSNLVNLNFNFNIDNEHGVHRLGNQGVSSIAAALSNKPTLRSLNLGLSHNAIVATGTEPIAKLLVANPELSKLNLNLGRNWIELEGMQPLAVALSTCNQLAELRLNFRDTELTNQALMLLADAIQPHCQRLSTLGLELSGNYIKQQGVTAIAALLTDNHKIVHFRLGLVNNRLGAAEVKILAVAILTAKPNLKIVELDLHGSSYHFNNQGNEIGDEGALALATAISGNHNISKIKLELTASKISPQGASALVEAISSHPGLVYAMVDLEYNEIGVEHFICRYQRQTVYGATLVS